MDKLPKDCVVHIIRCLNNLKRQIIFANTRRCLREKLNTPSEGRAYIQVHKHLSFRITSDERGWRFQVVRVVPQLLWDPLLKRQCKYTYIWVHFRSFPSCPPTRGMVSWFADDWAGRRFARNTDVGYGDALHRLC